MKSKLSITEFRNTLNENTKIGSQIFKMNLGIFSVFFPKSKYFYGKFDQSTFQLTINYNFNSAYYILKGNYKNNFDNKLKVNYSIEPMSKIRIIGLKYFPLIVFFGLNIFFYFKKMPTEVFIPFNLLIIFAILHSRWHLKKDLKNLESKFIEIFKVIE